MNVGTEVLETFASEPIPRTVCEGSLVPGCPHLGAPQVFAPSHCQAGEADYDHGAHQTQVTPSVTEPSLVHSRDRRWRPTEAGGAMERDGARCEERRGRLGPGAGRHQARCADQRTSADQATMPAKSPDFEIVSSHFGSAALTSNHIYRWSSGLSWD